MFLTSAKVFTSWNVYWSCFCYKDFTFLGVNISCGPNFDSTTEEGNGAHFIRVNPTLAQLWTQLRSAVGLGLPEEEFLPCMTPCRVGHPAIYCENARLGFNLSPMPGTVWCWASGRPLWSTRLCGAGHPPSMLELRDLHEVSLLRPGSKKLLSFVSKNI